MDATTTMPKGRAIIGFPFDIDIIFIVYRTVITRKYIFGAFLNCKSRSYGRNVKTENLFVLIIFFLYFEFRLWID